MLGSAQRVSPSCSRLCEPLRPSAFGASTLIMVTFALPWASTRACAGVRWLSRPLSHSA
jgi:hypothetical protein